MEARIHEEAAAEEALGCIGRIFPLEVGSLPNVTSLRGLASLVGIHCMNV
jgi:hypothetical protein